MGKTLYFEGAGMEGTGGAVGNCRIRTALTNDEGARYYLEIGGNKGNEVWRRDHPELDGFDLVSTVDYCFEITGDHEDCNERRHETERSHSFPFTLAGILAYVNNELGCSFDAVEIAPPLAGYRVHANRPDSYRFGDEFEFDPVSTARAEKIEQAHLEMQKAAGEAFPCLSVWRDEDDAGLLHVKHFRQGLGSFEYRID